MVVGTALGITKFVTNIVLPGGGYLLNVIRLVSGIIEAVGSAIELIINIFKEADSLLYMNQKTLGIQINAAADNLRQYYLDIPGAKVKTI